MYPRSQIKNRNCIKNCRQTRRMLKDTLTTLRAKPIKTKTEVKTKKLKRIKKRTRVIDSSNDKRVKTALIFIANVARATKIIIIGFCN